MEGEIWRPVYGYEGLYEVSNFGKVRSVNRWVPNGKGGTISLNSVALRPSVNTFGYFMVNLCKCGKTNTRLVHRLVASSFLKNEHGKKIVNHIDGNKKNNYVSNLEWCTASENTKHAYSIGLMRITECMRKTMNRSRAVVRIDMFGNSKTYHSLTSASICESVSLTSIANNLAGRSKYCKGGKMFKYA